MSKHVNGPVLAPVILAMAVALSACDKGDEKVATGEGGQSKMSEKKRDRPAARKSDPAPSATAAASAEPVVPEKRFDMTQDGKAMTADQFDAWMDAQGVRVVKAGATPVTSGDATVAKAAAAASTAEPSKD